MLEIIMGMSWMNDFGGNVLAQLIASIVFAVLSFFAGKAIGKYRDLHNATTKAHNEGIKEGIRVAKDIYRQRMQSAPEVYIDRLSKLISEAFQEGVTRASLNAKAIVAARNDLRDSLLSITNLLNTEITTLERITSTDLVYHPSYLAPFYEDTSDVISRADPREIARRNEETYEMIEVLHKKWPSKADQIKFAIRKLIAELGIDRLPDDIG